MQSGWISGELGESLGMFMTFGTVAEGRVWSTLQPLIKRRRNQPENVSIAITISTISTM